MKRILVNTSNHYVFCGLVPDDQNLSATTMRISDARCAIRWGVTDGIAELATTGPTNKSKLGAMQDLEAIHNIIAVWVCSDIAAEAWQCHG